MQRHPHGRLLVGFDGTSVPRWLRELVAVAPPAGVVLFARNIEDTPQLLALMAELRALWPAGGPPPLVAVDQEGGAVQRLKPPRCPEFPAIPPMRAAAALGPTGLAHLGRAMGELLASFGFNVNFAPVLDVDSNVDNPIIGPRAFGPTPEAVIAAALPFAAGLAAAGILACGKHFPGHGDTDVDSHLALPRLAHSRSRLEAVELAPFRAAVTEGLPMLMTAHIVFEALDPELPATLSPWVVPELLRRDLGYDGAVISDDLEMAAIADRFSADEVARGCLAADVDLLLVCRDLEGAGALADALARHESPSQAARAHARIDALRAQARDHAATPTRPGLGQVAALADLLATLPDPP